MSPSLEALLSRALDYAGLFPPAALPLPLVAQHYQAYLDSPESWMLNRLVLPAPKMPEIPPGGRWRLSLLVEDEPGPLPRQVESLETRQPRKFALPTYCEAPLAQVRDGFAKIRTGGLTPEAIPPAGELAAFLVDAASRRLPFKATAGLHHAIRALRPLTYAPDSPRAVMHGFLNVFAAAAFAWHGAEPATVLGIIEETDARAFVFLDRELHWRGRTLSVEQIRAARTEFAHSFGSCSFEEPVADLRELGLIP
jgi:hypothetical protein